MQVQDIEEAHMRFTRRGFLEDSEMPNLKKFAGATQWESIRKTLGRLLASHRIDLGRLEQRMVDSWECCTPQN